MSEIYLVRHAQASFGEKKYDQLSPTGVRQARILAQHMARIGRSFDAIYWGRMERQKNTARQLIDYYTECGLSLPQPYLCEAFDEYDSFGVWEAQIPQMLQEDPTLSEDLDRIYKDRKAFQRIFEKVMRRWVAGTFDPPGSTRWCDFTGRVREGLEEIMKKHGADQQLVIFTSGGPISAVIQIALNLSDEKAMEISWQIMNASVSRFKYNTQGIALAGFNDVSHLEMKKERELLTYR
jgi:broad specificity phosphatase PhoE